MAVSLKYAARNLKPIREGRVTKQIERQTARVPSATWLSLAIASGLISLGFQVAHKRETASFIGMWVPTMLLFGIYNKMVKQQGSE